MANSENYIDNYETLSTTNRRELALECIESGIDAAHPHRVVRNALALEGDMLTVQDAAYDLSEFEEILIIGGGKAAAQVAAELERVVGERIDGGVVVTNAPAETDVARVARGDHPIPSERGAENSREVRTIAEAATEDTLVLGIVTGGASALLTVPAEDISLAALRATTTALLESGATIHEINAVRKHLSWLKGGHLARAAAPATVVALVLSDVVGNDLDVIASGPFVHDPSTYDDALGVLNRYGLSVPGTVQTRLERGASGHIPETPKADDPAFESVTHHVVADGFTAVDAAANRATEAGYDPLILSSRITGESREAAKIAGAIVEESLTTGHPIEPPAVVVSGGETTVTVSGDGTGGPNQEFALATGSETTCEDVTVAAIDTDGIDGPTDAAGAIIDGSLEVNDTVLAALAANDVYQLLDSRDALIFTGPTGTNVNDLRVLVIDDADE